MKIKTNASERLSDLKDNFERCNGLRKSEEQMVHINGWRFGCVNYKVSEEVCQEGVPVPPDSPRHRLAPPGLGDGVVGGGILFLEPRVIFSCNLLL